MACKSISELFNCQAALVKLDSYENEFNTIHQIHSQPKEKRELLCRMSLDWLNTLKDPTPNNAGNKSKRLREEGNKVFNSKQENKEIRAALLYTEAIFLAADNHEALALSYANRAMSLQAFGYYRQAYDDCDCALEFGYPPHLRHKVITRQAYCALHLQDVTKLKAHIVDLKQMTLNEAFAHHSKVLEAESRLLYSQMKQTEIGGDRKTTEQNKPLNRQTQAIVSAPPPKGRHMIASMNIRKNSLIFTERAPWFVPVADHLICQQCAATQIIPIPCANCHGQVVYCSLKCRRQHADLHRYECVAYQLKLFEHVGIAHLALRIVLDDLSPVMPFLKDKSNAKELWQTLLELDESVDYALSLRMISHLNKLTIKDVLWFALTADMLLVYLINFTSYFEQFDNTAAKIEDWHLIVATLILRSIGQLICNGHTSISIMPAQASSSNNESSKSFALLQPTLWSRPYHIRLGQLHKLSCFKYVAAMNLPYLSICNHACAPSLRSTFDGRFVSAYATKEIQSGEEITNCYTLDFRKTRRVFRRDYLLKTYNFQCECEKCMQTKVDAEVESFHRYRCERHQCRQIFVPQLENLIWWSSGDDDVIPCAHIQCDVCKATQQCQWLHRFNMLLRTPQMTEMRLALYRHFESLDEWLIDYNELKMSLAHKIVDTCFRAIDEGRSFESSEFHKLAQIIKFYMQGVAAQSGTKSIEFVTKFTYLWDLMALGHCKCSPEEIQCQLDALDSISLEYKTIFLNYLKEFISIGL